jgi:hypothetical protein
LIGGSFQSQIEIGHRFWTVADSFFVAFLGGVWYNDGGAVHGRLERRALRVGLAQYAKWENRLHRHDQSGAIEIFSQERSPSWIFCATDPCFPAV